LSCRLPAGPHFGRHRSPDAPAPETRLAQPQLRASALSHLREVLPADRIFTRILHDLGDPVAGRPRDIRLTYSQHHCTRCRRYFTADLSDLAAPKARYTHRAVALAVRLVVEDGLPYQAASWHLWRDHRVFVPFATIQNWVEARGEKGDQPHRDRLPRLGPRRLLRVHRR
jgi:hypothetical protein